MRAGYIWGRLPGTGDGPVQLLSLADLTGRFGLASAATAKGLSLQDAGFNFHEGGLMNASEILGVGTWAADVTFENDNPKTVVNALVAATANASLTMQAIIAGIPTLVGNINFLAGGTVGAVVWSAPPFVNLAGSPFTLFAPASADATLADITGLVVGSAIA
jgi:hypothetical protein